MARVGRSDAVAEVRPAGIVRRPKHVLRVGEIDARLADIDIQAVLLQRTEKCHFDVDVVLGEGIVDEAGLPLGHFGFGNDAMIVLEFGRRAERHAGDLADPAGRHFVAILLDREPPKLRFRRGGESR